jgi:hypothetical protein
MSPTPDFRSIASSRFRVAAFASPREHRDGAGLLQRSASIACAAALFAGCGQRFNNDNLEVVNRGFDTAERIGKGGVSPKEVESILGPPKRVETYRLELETQKKELDGVRYYYEQDGQTLELHFLDNKLISKVPLLKTSEAVPAEKPTP